MAIQETQWSIVGLFYIVNHALNEIKPDDYQTCCDKLDNQVECDTPCLIHCV